MRNGGGLGHLQIIQHNICKYKYSKLNQRIIIVRLVRLSRLMVIETVSERSERDLFISSDHFKRHCVSNSE